METENIRRTASAMMRAAKVTPPHLFKRLRINDFRRDGAGGRKACLCPLVGQGRAFCVCIRMVL